MIVSPTDWVDIQIKMIVFGFVMFGLGSLWTLLALLLLHPLNRRRERR